MPRRRRDASRARTERQSGRSRTRRCGADSLGDRERLLSDRAEKAARLAQVEADEEDAIELAGSRQLREQGRTPVIDVGTLARIKAGEIGVFPGIRRLVAGGAEFVDGRTAKFDAIVLATGYRAGVAALFPETTVPVDDSGLPTQLAGSGELAGVYFVGFDVRQPGGLLRTIAHQAVAVAERIDATLARSRAA